MKYMTFNSSCAYAGVANMLECFGVDTQDRTIALAMGLPWLFSRDGECYMAGPMLQSARWFNLYLRPIGYEMVERAMPAAQLPAWLRQQRTAMLGLMVAEGDKHAVVYTGQKEGCLALMNNKWAEDPAPEELLLTDAELLKRVEETVTVATLRPVPPESVDLTCAMQASVPVIRQNLADICVLCEQQTTAAHLRARLNTLFRPLLLDGITMLNLAGQEALAQEFSDLQRGLLSALRNTPEQTIRLGEYLPVEKMTAAAEKYIKLIEERILRREYS